MESYYERVVREKKELDEKMIELESVIFLSQGDSWRQRQRVYRLDVSERLRMVKQYSHMREYSRVLGERIAAFKSSEPTDKKE